MKKSVKLIRSGRTRLLAVGVLWWLSLTGCGKREEYQIRLTSNERAMIDTLFVKQIDSLRPIWEKRCEDRHDSLVQAATDSIIRIRLEEEARLRARFPEK